MQRHLVQRWGIPEIKSWLCIITSCVIWCKLRRLSVPRLTHFWNGEKTTPLCWVIVMCQECLAYASSATIKFKRKKKSPSKPHLRSFFLIIFFFNYEGMITHLQETQKVQSEIKVQSFEQSSLSGTHVTLLQKVLCSCSAEMCQNREPEGY